MSGVERARQKITDSGFEFGPVSGGERHSDIARGKLGQFLSAAATGGDRVWTVSDNISLNDLLRSGGDHGGNRASFGTGAFRIGHILYIAADIDLPILGP